MKDNSWGILLGILGDPVPGWPRPRQHLDDSGHDMVKKEPRFAGSMAKRVFTSPWRPQ